ncbi:MAG: DNA alkylation repair protein [Clostridiaceae bacterium]|nr:DNA alkylation repair protein [Clostridiaceae bacterium]
MNFKQFCSDILILSDPETSAKMSAYMRDQFEFLGVPADKRRAASVKQFENAQDEGAVDWEFVEACWEQVFREFQYAAIDYLVLMIPFYVEDDFEKIEALIIDKPWWDTVDGFHKIVAGIVQKFPQFKENILEWSKDENIWLRRSAIIFQLSLKEKTDTELLSEIIKNNFGTEEFFINKAIGWALRQYGKTDPDWVNEFIKENKQDLSTLSYREATKIIKDGL